jgi:hypothetical protein
MNKLLEVARQYVFGGCLSVIPICADGSKKAAVPWAEYQKRRATEQELQKWFGGDHEIGLAIICGDVSDNLEVLDFDKPGIFDEFCDLATAIDPSLGDVLPTLPHTGTPSGGDQLFYRCSTIDGNQKLATSREPFVDCTGKKKKTIIETRGQGGYVLAPPTPACCHEANKPYEQIGSNPLPDVPEIAPEQRESLLEAARSFDERVKEQKQSEPMPNSNKDNQGDNKHAELADDYNKRGPSWNKILEPHDWVHDSTRDGKERWRRPGKSQGVSATIGYYGDNIYIFSTNADPFKENSIYNKFEAYALLNHKGNFEAATLALTREGYGKQASSNTKTNSNILGKIWGRMESIWLTIKPAPRRYLLKTKFIDHGRTVNEPRGVLPLGRVGMLVAAGAAGKSWALTLLALCVATGRDWLDTFMVEEPGPVLLALAEEEADEMRRRLYHGTQLLQLTPEQIELAAQNIVPLPLCGSHVTLTYGTEELRLFHKGKTPPEGAHETQFAQELHERLEKEGIDWKLIILDPASRFAGPDVEKDNAAATRFIQTLERLTEVPGHPTLLFAHHTNKSSRQGTTDAAAARGSSALTDGVRFQANLEVMERIEGANLPPMAMLRVTKSNYGLYPPELILCRESDHEGALRAATKEEVKARNEPVCVDLINKKPETPPQIISVDELV